MFFLATTFLFAAWCLRLLAVNDRLRRRDPWEQAWRQFERRQFKSPRSLP